MSLRCFRARSLSMIDMGSTSRRPSGVMRMTLGPSCSLLRGAALELITLACPSRNRCSDVGQAPAVAVPVGESKIRRGLDSPATQGLSHPLLSAVIALRHLLRSFNFGITFTLVHNNRRISTPTILLATFWIKTSRTIFDPISTRININLSDYVFTFVQLRHHLLSIGP